VLWVVGYIHRQKEHHGVGGKPQERLERITDEEVPAQAGEETEGEGESAR
jgi:hypothetical protein